MLQQKHDLIRGARIVEMFKQTAYNPIPVEIQTAIMWAMQNDFFDSIEVSQISSSVESLKEYLATQGTEVCQEIYSSGKLESDTEDKLRSTVKTGKELRVNPVSNTHGKYSRHTNKNKRGKKYSADYSCYANGCYFKNEEGTRLGKIW